MLQVLCRVRRKVQWVSQHRGCSTALAERRTSRFGFFSSRPRLLLSGELVTKRSFAMVYGFERRGSFMEEHKRAMVHRLEPLSKTLPEFERVLSENRQDHSRRPSKSL